LGKVIDIQASHNYNIIINDLGFEWDIVKNMINKKRHGISFESAATAFFDVYGILLEDTSHSETEERFVLLGYSVENELLVVCHGCREDETIRIISARKATKREKGEYRNYYEKRI